MPQRPTGYLVMKHTMSLFRRDCLVLTFSLILAGVSLGLYAYFLWGVWGPVLKSHAILAPRLSEPIALDYMQYWTASHLTLAGEPGSVYNVGRFTEVETGFLGLGGHPWPYPPTALLIAWPLALIPYIPSLFLWLGVTIGLYFFVLYRTAPHPLTLFWAMGFLGVFQNVYFGQNGFLSAALLGGGLLLIERRPFLAGAILGLLTYKPHLAALVPLALLAGRRWRGLSGFAASAVGLALAGVVFFGVEVWELFLRNASNTVDNLYAQSSWLEKMPTMFAGVHMAGFGVAAAWMAQAPCMLIAAALVVWAWRGPASPAVRAASLAVGVLLFPPHLWFYDLPILTIALAWIGWEGYAQGFTPWEKLLLLCAWVAPYAAYLLLACLKWPTGSLYLVPTIILIVRRR